MHTYKQLRYVGNLKKTNGLLGAFFGSGFQGKQNTACLALLLLLSSGVIYSFYNLVGAKEYWVIISPLITAIIGSLRVKNR